MTIVSSRLAACKVRETLTRSPACTRTRRARLESAHFCGDLVVAFGEGRKREIAGGAGCSGALHDTPNCDANLRQRGTGLVGDRAGHLSSGLFPCESSHAPQRQDRSIEHVPASHAKLYIIPWSLCHLCRRMRRTCDRLRCVALAGLLMLGPASGEVQPPVRQVLLLQSFDRGNLILDHFTATSGSTWISVPGRPVNIVQVIVGPTGFVGAPEQAIVDFIRSTYADRPTPDLIVTVAGPAAVFARKYRQQLFPDTPLLFAPVDQRYLQDAPLGENETAVAVASDFPRLIDDILQCCPRPGRCSW